MAPLLAKGLITSLVVVGVGLLAEKGKTTAAALLIQIPVISLGALWAASAIGRDNLSSVSGKMLLTMPTWIAWVAAVYLGSRYTSLPVWLLFTLGLLTWAIAAFIYLRLFGL